MRTSPHLPCLSHFENLADPPFSNPVGIELLCKTLQPAHLELQWDHIKGTTKPDWQALPPPRKSTALPSFAWRGTDWRRELIRAFHGAIAGARSKPPHEGWCEILLVGWKQSLHPPHLAGQGHQGGGHNSGHVGPVSVRTDLPTTTWHFPLTQL